MSGDPKFDASQVLPDFSYAKYAESLGLMGLRVDHPDQVEGAWDNALAAHRPVVVEAVVDPEVPPLPPHITLEQASALTKAILKGDPSSLRLVVQTLKAAMPSVLPKPRRS